MMKSKRVLFSSVIAVIGCVCILIMNMHYNVLARYPWQVELSSKETELIKAKLSQKEIDYIIDYSIAPSFFMDFIEVEGFNIYYVSEYRKIYDNYSYQLSREATVILVNRFIRENISIDDLLVYVANGYSYDELIFYLDELVDETKLVHDPYSIQLMMEEEETISNFQPKDLVLLEDLPQVEHDVELHLRNVAANALYEVCSVLESDVAAFCGGLQIKQAYVSYNQVVGFKDYQQGLSVLLVIEMESSSYHENRTVEWLQENAHHFGFIQTVIENAGEVVEFHLRYVGIDYASGLFEGE